MNRDHILSILLVASLWLVSCGDEHGSPSASSVPVTFTSGIDAGGGVTPSTRASDGSWSANDRVGIYMVPHNATPGAAANLPGALATNVEYRAASDGPSTALTPVGSMITFPGDGSQVNFVSYYPYHSTLHTAHGHIYPVDISTQDPLSAIDLLYHKGATPYSRTSGAVPLDFAHRLSKLMITVVPATGVTTDLSTATASLTGFPSQAGFHLSDGSLSGVGAADKILTPVKDSGSASLVEFSAILVPHASSNYTSRTITLHIDGDDFSYTLPSTSAHDFGRGLCNIYRFTFNGTKVILDQNVIFNWDEGITSGGNHVLTSNQMVFNLPQTASTGNTLILSTTATAMPTATLSTSASRVTDEKPDWITGVTLTKGSTSGGWTGYTATFDVARNLTAVSRTGYLHLEASGLLLVVRIAQAESTRTLLYI